jgi:hypothetical protein
MAIANTLSQLITDLDASPQVRQEVFHMGGRERLVAGTVVIAAADDDGSVYRFVRVHSSWSLKSIRCINTAVLAGTDYDCGLYQTAAAGGAVIDADCYADGFSLATAAPAVPPTADGGSGIELRFGDAATSSPNLVNNRVWNDAGTAAYTADPGLYFDLCLTGNTVGTAAGTVTLIVEYTAGD